MTADQEPPVKKSKIPVYGNFWNQDQVTGYRVVSSGPVPTHEELPPQEPGQEERPASPMYPTTKPPRKDVPQGGTPRGDL